jgi:hypothetical protein
MRLGMVGLIAFVIGGAAAGVAAAPPTGEDARGGAGGVAIGYVDSDRDGRNDRFQDANGDGVNDVTGRPYAHRFDLADGDGDGINDRFVDSDGDGVNDLGPECAVVVIDADGDGVNDITGQRYTADSLGGFRYGRIAEELDVQLPRFVDVDGDGMNDLLPRLLGRPQAEARSAYDRFVDEDGDGIHDARQYLQPRPNRTPPARREPTERPRPARRGSGHR